MQEYLGYLFIEYVNSYNIYLIKLWLGCLSLVEYSKNIFEKFIYFSLNHLSN